MVHRIYSEWFFLAGLFAGYPATEKRGFDAEPD